MSAVLSRLGIHCIGDMLSAAGVVACVAFLGWLLLVLTGCTLLKVEMPGANPPATADPATVAWQQQVTARLGDMMQCADVQVRTCVADMEAARKEAQP